MTSVREQIEAREAEVVRRFAKLSRRTYLYVLVGYDSRRMRLNADGMVGEGAGELEVYWWPEGESIVIAGADGVTTAVLRPVEEGVWLGRWMVREQIPVILAAIGRPS